MTNPWKLTANQQQALASIIGCNGSVSKASVLLGISVRCAHDRLNRAKARMCVETGFDALLKWDRWVRKTNGIEA